MHVEPQRARRRTRRQPAAARCAARVQRFGDAVDTDAIIPGEFCHLTHSKTSATKCFYFVRPEFRAAGA